MLYQKIKEQKEKISVIGLGYVGIPLAVSFARKVKVTGFDLNKEKVNQYLNGIDPTKEVGDEAIKNTTVEFTFDERKIQECKFHIVAVPTPINKDKTPDLKPVEGACEIVGRNLAKGSIVVFESTVFPGVTEDICVPILEKESGFKCGQDFFVGYSPERINPGDKEHRLENIVKIVSGQNEEILEEVAKTYELIIEAGVYRASSIKVAEAAKVIENSQRDINIAFVNELAMIFNRMNIDTSEVLKAAETKWNFLRFKPGLVGGHCIGVDPFYLVYKAKEFGYESRIIANGRGINDRVAEFIVENFIKLMIKNDKKIKGSKVGVLGITFKENCPDCRNTKVVDIVNRLKEYDVEVLVSDPIANKKEVSEAYAIELVDYSELKELDCLILAVNHDAVLKEINLKELETKFKDEKILLDIKGCLCKKEIEKLGFKYWRL